MHVTRTLIRLIFLMSACERLNSAVFQICSFIVLYTDCIVKIYPLRILYQIPHNFLRKKSNCIIDIQIYFWYIWIAERNYGTFGQCFQVRKHTIMYRHRFWIRFLPHNADYVVFLYFCPDFSHTCSDSDRIPL